MLVVLLCVGARCRAACGRVIIVYTAACSFGVRGYLALLLKCTGVVVFATMFGCFMAVILLVLLGASLSVGPHTFIHYLKYSCTVLIRSMWTQLLILIDFHC